ncbi:hypothetical protein ACFWM0_24810 [Streptomyces sp. NPDC058405]|uniref:hypothetical protein n=1 Tax=unclassified Streptomyces TaxID=2593676 RepID=UPI0036565B63
MLAATAAALAFSLSACGSESGLKSAGPTTAAVGPVRLWPGLPAISAPPLGFGESDKERVPGVRVTHNSTRGLDPVTVVRAEVAAHPKDATGAGGLPEQTVTRLADCDRRSATQGEKRPGSRPGTRPERQPQAPASCPVLKAYHHDLTGDGRDELIVGVTLPRQRLAVRCYQAENGGLTRIMSTSDQVVAVELAGEDLILRVVSAGIPGYEYRTAWSWDARQGTMLPAQDEIVPARMYTPPAPEASGAPSPSPPQGPPSTQDTQTPQGTQAPPTPRTSSSAGAP